MRGDTQRLCLMYNCRSVNIAVEVKRIPFVRRFHHRFYYGKFEIIVISRGINDYYSWPEGTDSSYAKETVVT
jgi:hypothetical protein